MRHNRDILCSIIVLTILVFGSMFEETIFPAVESQLSSTLKITKLTTGGGDTFDFTVTGPTSYNPSINTAGSGSLNDNVVVYHNFDSDQLVTGNANLRDFFINAGSFGHNADAFGLASNLHFDAGYNSPGILGDGYTQSNNLDTVILGNWNHEDQWNFLVDDQTEKYSINLWMQRNGGIDADDILPGLQGSSLLGTINQGTSGGSLYNAFNLWIDEDSKARVDLYNDGSRLVSITGNEVDFVPESGNPDSPTMITFVIDKSGSATIYINGSNPVTEPITDCCFTPITGSAGQIDYIDAPLSLSPNQILQFTNSDYEPTVTEFAIDDLCIIKDYIFSQDDLDALYNNGQGMPCVDVTNSGTSTVEVPYLSQYDQIGSGSLEAFGIDLIAPDDFAIGHVPQTNYGSQTIKNIRLLISGSASTTGMLNAVILSGITHPDFSTIVQNGDEVIEAVSDSMDFTDPKFIGNDYFTTFNFTTDVGTLDEHFTAQTWSVADGNNNQKIKINTTSETLDFDISESTINHQSEYDFGTNTNLNATNWILRYKLTVNNLVQGVDNTPVILNVGIGDSGIDYGGTDVQDIIGLRYFLNNNNNKYEIFDTDNTSPFATVADATFSHTPIPETLYVQIELTSATTYEVTLFSDSLYTNPIETHSGTTTATNFQYVKVFNDDGGDGTEDSIFNGVIDDLQVISTRIYPGALIDFNSADNFIGLNGTDIEEGTLTFQIFTGEVQSGGEPPICMDYSNPSALWDTCNNYSPSILGGGTGIMYEINVEAFDVSNGQIDSINFVGNGAGGGGMGGMDGPTPVDPGTYSIQESTPAGWNLTTATCNDGSSSFSVDTVSGIVIGPGDNIECTFENELSSLDTDGDGIYNNVDTLPATFSDDFSDIPLAGTSSGTITTRGDQILTITEEPNPAGVRITADISGGLLPATVNACGGLSLITLSSGDEVVVTCGSVTLDVINGPVDITFISFEGTQATTSLSAENSITFDQDNFSFVAPPTNTQTIIIDVEGTPITIGPGDTNTSPPEVGTIISSQDPIQTGTLVTASATFTDLGPLETHTAEWDWGDQTTTAGVVTENGLSGTVTGSHTYSTPGVYTVTLTVTDDTDDSGSSTFQFIVIYDPSGGFVTGGGWINSPEGAYVAEPSLFGKATFGFVSKYQQGANIPTGNTQFSFQVADLKFKSTEYDWLVVAGSNVKFKGTGTINGQGNYGFQLFAFDADLNTNDSHLNDKFRIKIWDKNNGDVVVYDNELGQSEADEPSTIIGVGSIVIHN